MQNNLAGVVTLGNKADNLRAFGDYQGSDYAIDSRRMIVIARRRGR